MTMLNQLEAEITRTGYYPEFVTDSIRVALGGEHLKAFILQHEATFDQDQLHRHLTVVMLTHSRLIVSHTDEHQPDEVQSYSAATTSTEAVQLKSIASVVVQRVVSAPENFSTSSEVQEVVITIGWGAVSRIDVGPAGCDDPNCEAEHGFTGTSVNDDLQIRVSRAADGAERVSRAWEFASALSEITATTHA